MPFVYRRPADFIQRERTIAILTVSIVGWKKLAFTSEPPTPNAWNQLKLDAGTGWRKLLQEGE